MKEFIDRENTIFDVLNAFTDAGLEYVVVGGYAVSAYEHRFSVDADLVIKAEDLEAFAAVLEDRGFGKAVEKELDAYGGRFVASEKDAELPVSIDLLVNGLTSRQTDATWSYDYLRQHAHDRVIAGSERAVTAAVPDREVLIAIKLHSGRLTDVRDVVALAGEADLADVTDHLDRGDDERLEKVLDAALGTLQEEGFADAFKGVFVRGELPGDTINRVQVFLQDQIDNFED